MKYTQYVRGTNQYKKKEKLVILQWFIVFMIILDLCLGFRWLTLHYKNEGITQAWAEETVVSPVSDVTPTPEPTEVDPNKEIIEEEVKRVFGKDYPNAKRVLDCENFARNPKALNDNTKWGGRGKDWGVFQINDSWQGVTNISFLTDYKINIQMAHNIFKSWGNNFQAWTCGKKMGI